MPEGLCSRGCERKRFKRALCRPCYRREPDVREWNRRSAKKCRANADAPSKPRCCRGCDRGVHARQLCRPCYRKEPDQRAVSHANQLKLYAESPKHRASKIAWATRDYAENREAKIASAKAHRDANLERVRAREARYNEANREVRLAYYRATQPVRLAQAKQYREANRPQRALLQRHRVARQRNAEGSFTLVEWTALCERFGWVCPACGEGRPLTADHIVPLSKGGSNRIENIQPLCRPCNSSKHVRTVCYEPWPHALARKVRPQ